MIKKHHLAKKIIQIHPLTLQIIQIYNSIIEGSIKTNFNSSLISKACRGEIFQVGGYYWRFYDEFINNNVVYCYNSLKFHPFWLTGCMFNYINPCFNFISNEIWKPIDGYNGLYQVSNFGRVISLYNKPFIKELKPQLDKDGYLLVSLYNDKMKKICKLHHLVAKAFISNPNNYSEINHKNEIKNDNREDNLEWCTHDYNCNYGTRNERVKITKEYRRKNIVEDKCLIQL